MRKLKKAAAMGLTAAMLMGSTATVFAAEGEATGSGDYEGYVEETSVFTVNVPTDASATKGFDFFVDPNGLLAATDYARITGVSADDFETGATLFFERTPVAADVGNGIAAVTKYGKDSEALTFENQSSYAVNVEVSASVTGADGITLGTVDGDTTAPTIYLALVTPGESDSVTTPITADGATVTGTIEGENSNFEIVYKEADEANNVEAGYYYEKRTATDANPLAPWKTYSFNLTGACGGTWTADQAEVAPTVTLTWKVTDPEAEPEGTPVANATMYGGDVYVRLVTGQDANSAKVTSVKVDGIATTNYTVPGAVAIKGITGSGTHTIEIVYDGTTYIGTVTIS